MFYVVMFDSVLGLCILRVGLYRIWVINWRNTIHAATVTH